MAYLTKTTSTEHRDRSNSGFTVVEILVAATISLVAIGCTFSFLLQSTKSLAHSESYLEQRTSTRSVVNRIYKEARSATEIYSCTEDTFEFSYTDPSGNSSRVKYYYDATSGALIRSLPDAGTSRTVLTDISSAKFDYFDRTGTVISTADVTNINTNGVRFCFYDQTETESRTKSTYMESSIVMLRNKTLVP